MIAILLGRQGSFQIFFNLDVNLQLFLSTMFKVH